MKIRTETKIDLFMAFLVLILLFLWIVPAFATKKMPPMPDQSQEQSQHQSQEQHQDQEQNLTDNSSVDASSTTTVNHKVRAVGSGASSGNSSSDCQKVRDLRGADGWLFGIRWDMTDQDCRRLTLAESHYTRGNVHFANTLTCSVKIVYSAFEGGSGACKAALAADAASLTEALTKISQLEAQNARLIERYEYAESERQAEVQACDERIERCMEATQK